MCGLRRSFALLTLCTVATLLSAGQAPAAPVAPSSPAPQTQSASGGTEEKIDQRLQFLMDQLAGVEASINEINRTLRITSGQQTANKAKVEASAKGNELMNRQAGGPVPWQEFYGNKPSGFFMRGRETTAAGVGRTFVYSNRSGGVSNRPSQFNYVYKANNDVQKHAAQEIAALGQKADVLQKRRQELEAEQIVLWCKIALRAVAVQELAAQPLYRFDPQAPRTDANAAAHAEAVRAAVAFLREANRLALAAQKEVEANPARTFSTLEQSIASARSELEEHLLDQPSLTREMADAGKPLGKVKALAQQLEDVATNTADAYQSAQKYDRANDERQRNLMRAKFQQAMFGYAEALLAADESVDGLAAEWHVVPDTAKAVAQAHTPPHPASSAQLAANGASPAASPQAGSAASDDSSSAGFLEGATLYHGHYYKVFSSKAGWKKASQACEAMGGHLACAETEEEQKFLAKLKGDKAVWLGGVRDDNGRLAWLSGQPIPLDQFNEKFRKAQAQVSRQADAAAIQERWSYVLLVSEGNLRLLPEDGVGPKLKKKVIQGYICEWDGDGAAAGSASAEPASNEKENGKGGKRHKK